MDVVPIHFLWVFVISLPGEILMSYFLIILLKIKNMSLANSLIQEKGIFTCCLNMDELVLPKRTAVTEKFNKENNHIDGLASGLYIKFISW